MIKNPHQVVILLINYKNDPGIDKSEEVSPLGIFVVSYSKTIMKKYFDQIDGFYSIRAIHQDRNSFKIHTAYYQKLKQAGIVGNSLGREKNDYGDGGVFYGLFNPSKMELCYTKDKNGILKE